MHIYLHNAPDPETIRLLTRLNDNLERFMSDIDDFVGVTLAKIHAQKTQIDGMVVLLTDVKHKLADALAGETLSPSARDKLAAIMPALEANASEITAALVSNTDVVPPVELVPAPDRTPAPAAPAPVVPEPAPAPAASTTTPATPPDKPVV